MPSCSVAFGCSASADQLLQRFVGIARRDMYEVVFGELKRDMPAGLLEERERRVWARCMNDLERVPGVERGPRGADRSARNASPRRACPTKLQMKLRIDGPRRPFRAVIIFSTALVARGKPAPDIYLHAAQATGHPADACIVIEDSRHGIAGARAAGMRTVGFAGGGHATEGLCQELLDAGASIVISHMRDLPCAIRSLCDLKERRT